MKYSLTALSMAALAVAKPAFLNTGFDVQEGEPFTLEFSGCEGGCTISLQHGPDDNLLDFKPLTSDATGGSFTFTLDNIPSDTYAFKIENNETGEDNWSRQFEYEGEGEPIPTVTVTMTTEPESTTSTTSTTTSSAPTTTTAEETTTEEETSTVTTPSSSSERPSNTRTSDPSPTDDDDEPAQTSDIPDPDGDDDAAGSLGAPITLVLAAVVGLLVLH
jgi:hypothetical protein